MPNRSSFRNVLTVATLLVITLLQGCGQEIDARQTKEINGLLYKLNDNDPFTGKVTNYPLQSLISTLGSCTLEVKKGKLNGKFSCVSNSGAKLTEIEYKDGGKNGVEKKWDHTTGNLTSNTEWKDNLKDGVDETYDPATKTLIEQTHWVKGIKNGAEKKWEADGKTLYVDLDWKDGKQTGFEKYKAPYRGASELIYMQEINYKDGNKHGLYKQYEYDGTTGKWYLFVVRNYANGYFDGIDQQWDKDNKLVLERQYKNNILVSETQISATVKGPDNLGSSVQGEADKKRTTACVDSKIGSYRKEMGEESPISMDMMSEWEGECTKNSEKKL